MIENIDLTDYNFAFEESEVNNLSRKNFIYGKNGTGKSSLVSAIFQQYSEKYDIRIFNGWQGVIGENDRLDAISLGEKNTEIQSEINIIDKTIHKINLDLIEPSNNKENVWKKAKSAEEKYSKQDKKIQKFFTDAAREISITLSLGRNYKSPNFKSDIESSNLLTASERDKFKNTILSERINLNPRIKFPIIELFHQIKVVNDILKTKVSPSSVIKELTDNFEKQDFAKKGMKIHERSPEETCAFCGANISKIRWDMLDQSFSNEVEKFEDRINNAIGVLNNKISVINDVSAIDKGQFYPEFIESLQEINIEILENKDLIKDFLGKLIDILEEKKTKASISFDLFKEEIPKDFSSIKSLYNKLYDENKRYSDNLKAEQTSAKNKLIYHEVKTQLDDFGYFSKRDYLKELENTRDLLRSEYNKLEAKKMEMHSQRQDLIAQSTNEISAVRKINKFLRGLGSHSFELDHIQDVREQKGQYRVKDYGDKERSLQTLSTGEKNIVAFLWFMNNLEEAKKENQGKEKVVIFDDPMNSNDDNCQYLIMGLIQKFYREQNHPQMFLLTHNNHFFLQVTPISKQYLAKKSNTVHRYFRLIKVEKKTEISLISADKNNLKSIYDELWEELKFAYELDKTIFMWNNMRRILETYNRFILKNSSPADIEHEIEDLADQTLAIALVKSLNVNSHIGYETDVDISGKTKYELKAIFKDIFVALNASRHFDSYWEN